MDSNGKNGGRVSLDHLAVKGWVRAYSAATGLVSRHVVHGLYDGRRLEPFARRQGPVSVLFAIPPMSDVNGALPHPGVQILQTILRHRGVSCEILNYNLPVSHPNDPFQHLIRAIQTLGVKILGVSLYSQAIRNTLEGLQRVKRACPELIVVLGGPHPTESYRSLMGVSFVDYVCRGESEESFPQLVDALLRGEPPLPGSIPGVYRRDRHSGDVHGVPAEFIDVQKFDREQLLRYHFRPEEIKQYRLYRGAHGTAGAAYWPVALVRGCPYDCTFCAAYQMSGKKLRYRDVRDVADDLEHYLRSYGCRHFSFIDDAFTQHYGYVIDLCEEILRRGLRVYWTTDNGIRYETLGAGKVLERLLEERKLASVDELIALMIRAGWRGTAVGIESGSARVRRDLVRKGGAQLTNDGILANLRNLKRVSRREGVYFYVNGFLMAGFPELPLHNGKHVPAETVEEMEQTGEFALALRDHGAIDMMNLSMVIPLPATDMWDCLTIGDKIRVLLSCVPPDHPDTAAIEGIRRDVLARYAGTEETTRYAEEPEAWFWQQVYPLSDDAQIRIMASYDAFNADAAHTIDLKRPDPAFLWSFRERVVDRFYSGARMKLRMLKHVVHRSSSPQDVFAYLTLMARKYAPEEKRTRAVAGTQ
ncbi:MAG TPA: radical SAM protein [Candidatus Polarisedimenticolaceae bacterium]|nr:radical SAM protein [Candidatus Polarisedimenticolaceae bacterium]